MVPAAFCRQQRQKAAGDRQSRCLRVANANLRVLIVDDETPARDLLRMLCAEQRLTVVGETGTGEDAVALAETLAPDLVLLDIAMPGTGGMAAARQISRGVAPPAIVFTTAFEGYALAAFDVGAVDYLLKPIVDDRFAEMLGRVRLQRGREAPIEDHIWVPVRSELRRIALSAIDRVSAERDYVRLEVDGRSHLLRATMEEIDAKLDPAKFLRIHRSTILRRDVVTALRHDGGGVWSALIASGEAERIGRSYLDRVRSALGR
ncbi:DNA-binding response regulator [Sphingomonas koreensis]|nr:DNA-binding response regulator [Sphingomonas koreensis]